MSGSDRLKDFFKNNASGSAKYYRHDKGEAKPLTTEDIPKIEELLNVADMLVVMTASEALQQANETREMLASLAGGMEDMDDDDVAVLKVDKMQLTALLAGFISGMMRLELSVFRDVMSNKGRGEVGSHTLARFKGSMRHFADLVDKRMEQTEVGDELKKDWKGIREKIHRLTAD